MEERGANYLPQDVIDAANNNPFARYEFGGLVEQATNPPARAREVTIVDFKGELDLKPGEKTSNGFNYRGPRANGLI